LRTPSPSPYTTLFRSRVSTDPGPALLAQNYFGVQTGTLGRSVRAKVPIRGVGGEVIGFVSVGVLEKPVSAHLRSDLPVILIPPLDRKSTRLNSSHVAS